MTIPAYGMSSAAREFTWLLSRFANESAGVVEVIVLSSDGLLIAKSPRLPRADADRLAAISSALASLAEAASRVCHVGETNKVVIDFEYGYLLVAAIGPGSALGVIAGSDANVDDLAYDMAVLANRTAAMFTPTLVEELMMTAPA